MVFSSKPSTSMKVAIMNKWFLTMYLVSLWPRPLTFWPQNLISQSLSPTAPYLVKFRQDIMFITNLQYMTTEQPEKNSCLLWLIAGENIKITRRLIARERCCLFRQQWSDKNMVHGKHRVEHSTMSHHSYNSCTVTWCFLFSIIFAWICPFVILTGTLCRSQQSLSMIYMHFLSFQTRESSFSVSWNIHTYNQSINQSWWRMQAPLSLYVRIFIKNCISL